MPTFTKSIYFRLREGFFYKRNNRIINYHNYAKKGVLYPENEFFMKDS